jgi:CheY-like chemotaxis protein/DNA-directed RNA polymerase subunit RPC12/RpoP
MSDQQATYMCVKCDSSFRSTEAIRFCNKCGSTVKLVDGDITRKVLIIDDSILTRNKITAILKNLGVRVVAAADGPSGLKLAQTSNPDLIVLDIEMPQMDGLEVLAALRAQKPNKVVPVVMLTGHADLELVKKALAAGASDYILKDKSVLEIANRLKKFLSP